MLRNISLQSVVSTLSKGPVAPSDKIGRSDVALIMKSCAKDGTLLQGDKPAMKVDSNHIQAAFQCDNCGPKGELWATTTTLAGNEPFSVVMGATLKENYKMALQELGLGNTKSSWVGYEANATASLVDVSQGISFKACGKWDFQIWAFAAFDPNSGFALLGEQSKWVPVSRARFSDLEHSSSMTSSGHWQEAAVTAKGSYGEELVVSWAHSESGLKPITIKCTIPESSTIRIRVTRTDKSFNTYCGDHLYSN